MALTRLGGRLLNPEVFDSRADALAGRVNANVDYIAVYNGG